MGDLFVQESVVALENKRIFSKCSLKLKWDAEIIPN
jgi:hypothetical protein